MEPCRPDTEVGGQAVAAGEKVVMFYRSGNQDETMFADPLRFDVTRSPNNHLAFGGGRPHFCLGSHLARTQLAALFGEIVARLPDLEVGEPEYLAGNFINGIKRLPVRFTPTTGDTSPDCHREPCSSATPGPDSAMAPCGSSFVTTRAREPNTKLTCE